MTTPGISTLYSTLLFFISLSFSPLFLSYKKEKRMRSPARPRIDKRGDNSTAYKISPPILLYVFATSCPFLNFPNLRHCCISIGKGERGEERMSRRNTSNVFLQAAKSLVVWFRWHFGLPFAPNCIIAKSAGKFAKKAS